MILKLKVAVTGLMSLGLIATICAVVRATSLGTVTTDLSYAYCIAAIWANTELHLGIIATNMALARSIYAFYRGRDSLFSTKNTLSGAGPRSTNGYTGASNSQLSRNGWIKSENMSVDEENAHGKEMNDTSVEISGSRGSNGSEIPLGPVIKKTTGFHVSEGKGRVVSVDRITQGNWNLKEGEDRTFYNHR